MATYTFITDFQGGTYVCQKDAEDLLTACFLWKAEMMAAGYIPGLNDNAFSNAFDADIDELPPVPLDGLRNVWLFHLMFHDDILDLHIVQTDTSLVDAPTLNATSP